MGSTASARAIATRWRWPPDSSCGNFAAMTSGGTSPTASSSSSARSRTLALGDEPVDPKRPRNVVLDPLDGVERGERVLEDHLDVRAVAAEAATPSDPAHVLAAEPDRARRRFVEPRQQTGDGALAASARADESSDAARAQREADVVDRAKGLALSVTSPVPTEK